MSKAKVSAMTFLLAMSPAVAFADDGGASVPIVNIFERLIVMLANIWTVLVWVLPIILLASALFTGASFLKREQIGTGIVIGGVGIFFAIMLGFSMYKAGPSIRAFAQKVGNMDTTVIQPSDTGD
ncbi:MAG: hypothetical protein GWP10_06735 [Nitrospiraceae bacterium]|nr:hypothetical protein [Nitrospiraceae bacterium]